MKKFEFSGTERSTPTIFSGQVFYDAYKGSEFLRHYDHIESLLSKGYELRNMLKDVEPGERVIMTGFWLNKNTPLLVLKTVPFVAVENHEFTANRLTGLVAAYAFDNRHKFPTMKSSDAVDLGLTWDNSNSNKCRLYLSAVSGTEHFYSQFLYWPLVCALRKLYLKKITLKPVIKMAKIKNKDGIRMGHEMMSNFAAVIILWRHFPGATDEELKTALKNLPAELKNVLK
ncbi:uncharacterized protein [Epargyreus clarus]|uniref:uncharacterized protein n=1 Tax=Epargyreus clarus TaxID=520877 RepID=UPI003C2BD34A